MANKTASGSRSTPFSDPFLLPRVPVEGNEVKERFVNGGGSYADASPDPWCRTASVAGAPFLNLLFLCCRWCFFLVLASGAGKFPGLFSGASSWWRGMVGGGSGSLILNKLAGSPDLAPVWSSCFSLCCHGGRRKEMRGVRSGGRRTIFVRPWSRSIAAVLPLHDDKPQNLMVERRPIGAPVMAGSFSSRPLCQKGGSYVASTWRFQTLPPAVHRRCCSDPSAPSGFVPGGGGIGPELKLATRTRLHFSFVFWGPVCKVCGPDCNFYPSDGSVCKMYLHVYLI